VRGQPLGLGDGDHVRSKTRQGAGVDGHGVDVGSEVVGSQRGGESGRAGRREHVVGAGDVVAHAGGRVGAEEHRAGPSHHGHQRVRLLVSKGLTPRTIGRLEDELRGRAARLVSAALDAGSCDFVETVGGELPMQAICILLGIPESDRHQLFEWIEHSFDFKGDRGAFETTDDVARAAASMFEYGTALIADKRAHPADDMLSIVCNATLPGEDPPQLTDQELQFFFSLVWAAGADTTRNAIAGAVVALTEFPGELAVLRDDADAMSTGVEEIVRWTHPAAYNRRTATRETQLAGQRIEPGDKVVFWEASANRDELVFAEPFRFDARRQPNPHLGFGHGVHHCLGASLARLEIRVVLTELLARAGRIELAGPVEWTRSNKHTGIRHLPVRLDAR